MTASYAALPFIELDPSEGHLTALSQDGDIVAVGTSLVRGNQLVEGKDEKEESHATAQSRMLFHGEYR